jgi:hypothetical protein
MKKVHVKVVGQSLGLNTLLYILSLFSVQPDHNCVKFSYLFPTISLGQQYRLLSSSGAVNTVLC